MYFFILASALVASIAAADPGIPNSPCVRRNSYIKVDGQCDAYIECRDFAPIQKLCPDGLHYNPLAAWPNYPCGYPSDVACLDRSVLQPAQPTPDCPHQFGYFPSPVASPNDCGQYRMCVLGKPYEMLCPTGLAFSFATGRCDWADLVPTCDVSKFLGFQCPAASFDESGNAIKTNHRYEGNCYAFFSCESGKPRLLSCDPGLAFDAASEECIDADKVACVNNAIPTPQVASAPL